MCGFAHWDVLKRILAYVDLVLYDFKHMDSAKHREYTGVPNEIIFDNAKKIYHALHLPLLTREIARVVRRHGTVLFRGRTFRPPSKKRLPLS